MLQILLKYVRMMRVDEMISHTCKCYSIAGGYITKYCKRQGCSRPCEVSLQTQSGKKLEKHAASIKQAEAASDSPRGGKVVWNSSDKNLLQHGGDVEEVYAVDDLDALVGDIANYDAFNSGFTSCVLLALSY